MNIPVTAAILLALGAVEATAWWWMHPTPTGLNQPVLAYRPGIGDRRSKIGIQKPLAAATAKSESQTGWPKGSETNQEGADAVARSTSLASPSTINSQLSTSPASSLSTLNPQLSTSSLTPLPEVVAAALPSLRCSTGTAARIDRDDGATIHLAFFEWDLADSTNVLEAFKHLPDECMGSIGMTLIEKRPPRTYLVGDDKSEDRNQPSSSPTRKSTIKNQQSSSSPFSLPNLPSPISHQRLVFDHTVFRDPAGVIVHAFKGTWVSGANSLLDDGARGGVEQWNQLRWKSALKRFRPAHARVAQGAVRGIPNPDFAWEAFEQAMLVDLRFQ